MEATAGDTGADERTLMYTDADMDDEDIEYDGPPHVGHWSRLGGTWWCDTCNSPYCELA